MTYNLSVLNLFILTLTAFIQHYNCAIFFKYILLSDMTCTVKLANSKNQFLPDGVIFSLFFLIHYWLYCGCHKITSNTQSTCNVPLFGPMSSVILSSSMVILEISTSYCIVLFPSCDINKYPFKFITPLPACRWTLSLLAVCSSVSQSVRQFVTRQFSRLFFAVFWDIDLKFGICICPDIIQIKFDFGYAWPSFTGVIALC